MLVLNQVSLPKRGRRNAKKMQWFLPPRCMFQMFPVTQKKKWVHCPFLFPERKGWHQEKYRKAGRNFSNACWRLQLSCFFPICLKHPRETGRDGIPAACVLGNIRKVRHLPTPLYFKFSQTWLWARAVLTISKPALQVFCSRNLLWFPWPVL